MSRVSPFTETIRVFVDHIEDPKVRSAHLAQVARDGIAEIVAGNELNGLGGQYEVYVDGHAGGRLDDVKPDGVIVAEFGIVTGAVAWIVAQLTDRSPVLTGRYARSHLVFADDAEVPSGAPLPQAVEYVIVNAQPYARKIERGQSHQAPDGVYEAVAAVAARRFGNVARIGFTFRAVAVEGGETERQPAIVIRVG